MKKLILISAVVISSIYVTGCKPDNNNINLVQQEKEHRDSISSLFTNSIGYRYWKLSSETITTAGVTTSLTIDSCSRPITYVFNNLDSNVGNQGSMTLHYSNSICNGFVRNKDATGILYNLEVNPNTLQFPDDGHDLTRISYLITRATTDSLVLKRQTGSSTIIEVYLSLK